MHQQQPVNCRIRKRQIELFDQRGEGRPCRGPFHHALRGWHEGKAALRLLAEKSEVRRCIADACNTQAPRVAPAGADAAAHEATRNRAQRLSVEVAQINDVEKQGDRSAWSWRTRLSLMGPFKIPRLHR